MKSYWVTEALFLAAPLPEQCVPQGPKSNPMDIDPDRYVGAPSAWCSNYCWPGSEEAEPEATEAPRRTIGGVEGPGAKSYLFHARSLA